MMRAATGLLLVWSALGAGCREAAKPKPPRTSVTVAQATRRDVPFTLDATGIVEPVATASVSARVSGTVTRVAFREGEEVAQGAVLFVLDDRPFRAAHAQAQALWDKDRAQAALAHAQARRAEALSTQSLTALSDLDQARATADMWAATVRADSAAVHAARLTLDYATVRAPIAGRTGALLVHQGDLVQAGSATPLVTVNRLDPVRVRFTVPASALPLIRRYRHATPRVTVGAPGEPAESRVSGPLVFVDNAVDPASGTLQLKGEFANPHGALLPGQYVDVRLELYVEAGATVVPSVAVTRGQSGAFVYVLQPDSTVTPRPVTVTRTVDSLAVLDHGLAAGETVITDGQLRLSPGAKVAVRTPGSGDGGGNARTRRAPGSRSR